LCCFVLLQIEVRLPNNFLCMGCLEYYNLQYNVAVVSVPPFYVFSVACLDHQRSFEPGSLLVAVGRCFNSGMLMATPGMLTDNPRGAYREEFAVSTCGITLVCPLFIYLLTTTLHEMNRWCHDMSRLIYVFQYIFALNYIFGAQKLKVSLFSVMQSLSYIAHFLCLSKCHFILLLDWSWRAPRLFEWRLCWD
jgi:hypothetical protein